MSGEPVRASNAEREGSVALLREHFVEGRLALEEFVERVNALYEATTLAELEAPLRDLQVASAARRGVTRFVLALFGSSEREGRLRVRRRVLCLAGFGNIDLDLRQATFERDCVTILLLGAFSALDTSRRVLTSTYTDSSYSGIDPPTATTHRRGPERRSCA